MTICLPYVKLRSSTKMLWPLGIALEGPNSSCFRHKKIIVQGLGQSTSITDRAFCRTALASSKLQVCSASRHAHPTDAGLWLELRVEDSHSPDYLKAWAQILSSAKRMQFDLFSLANNAPEEKKPKAGARGKFAPTSRPRAAVRLYLQPLCCSTEYSQSMT